MPRSVLKSSALLRDAQAAPSPRWLSLATGGALPRRPLRWAAALALLGVLLTCGIAWAQPSGVVVSEGTLDGRVRLVVSGDGPITVSVDGQLQPTTTTPLVSERTALALVATREAPMGIVYATDAHAEPAVSIAGVFPEDSHDPITYPAALVKGAADRPAAVDLFETMKGTAARAVFEGEGFTLPPAQN